MSIQTKCDECGEWFHLGTNHNVGEPCYACKQKKLRFSSEIEATYPQTYVVPAGAPMVPGRKLRDALMEAGYAPEVTIKRSHDAAHAGRRGPDFCGVKIIEDAPRPSFIRLIGSIAWRLLVVMVVVGVTVVVLAGGRA